MKKIFRWFFLVVGALIIGFIFIGVYLVATDYFYHNKRLSRMYESFNQIKHPPETSNVKSFKSVGLLSGNGNHCDYFVAEIRKFSSNQESIIQWYKTKHISGPDNGKHELRITFIEDGVFEKTEIRYSLPYDYDTPRELLPLSDTVAGTFYVVYCFLCGYDRPGWDLRCH